tara:strand:- start:167 stop:598 length:432 start_codon:yes stop_codon:yes gene_type:complete
MEEYLQDMPVSALPGAFFFFFLILLFPSSRLESGYLPLPLLHSEYISLSLYKSVNDDRYLAGVGRKLSRKLEAQGIMNCGELRKASKEELQREYGQKQGEQLSEMSRGIDSRPLVYGKCDLYLFIVFLGATVALVNNRLKRSQ